MNVLFNSPLNFCLCFIIVYYNMNVFNWLLFNSPLNFYLCFIIVYCNTIFIVQLCYVLANVIFTPVNSLTR